MTTAMHDDDVKTVSGAIKVARVLCILCVVYMHPWIGVSGDELFSSPHFWDKFLIYWTQEAVARSAVPLLSVVSGWLVLSTVQRKVYGDFINGKARAILLPMLIWNVIALAVVSVFAGFGFLAKIMPQSPIEALNELVFLYERGAINVQNSFLRDLFVCMLVAPFLIRLSPRWLWALLITSVVWQLSEVQLYILLRPQILTFFIIGILARASRWDRQVVRWPVLPILAAAAVAIALKVNLIMYPPEEVSLLVDGTLELALRISVALAFWRMSVSLAQTRFLDLFKRIEPYTFLLFCSHVIIIRTIGPVLGQIFGKFGDPLFLPYYFAQPFIALFAAILLGLLLVRVSPTVAHVMSGGRLGAKARQPREPRGRSASEQGRAFPPLAGE